MVIFVVDERATCRLRRGQQLPAKTTPEPEQEQKQELPRDTTTKHQAKTGTVETNFGLVYRIEIHLPDTQNLDTYRAIFRAIREELGA